MKTQRPKTGQSNRGGARPGAGRPVGTPNPNAGRRVTSGPKMTASARAPSLQAGVNLVVRISPRARTALAALAAAGGPPSADRVRALIYAHLDEVLPEWTQ